MIKHFFSLLILTIFFGCSPIKKINSNVISGEFDKAINKTISELKKTKNKKKIIQYESILLDIYNRSVISSKDIIGSSSNISTNLSNSADLRFSEN